ncbi:MAG: hypothetical protein WC470_00880 [Candidatus Paceibacterota bacterium]
MATETVSTQVSGFENPNTNPFFYIPLLERVMERGDHHREYREVDGIGLFVCYDNKADVTDEIIQRWTKQYPRYRKWDYCVIQAESPEEAIKTFHKDYRGAKIGKKSKALIINWRKKIIELPYCPLIHIGKKTGRFMCGPPVENNDPNWNQCMFGDCVLNVADYPDETCALKNIKTWWANFPGQFPKIKPIKITVDGKKYLFISLRERTAQITLPTD